MDIGIRRSKPLIASAHTRRMERERRDQNLQSDVLISTVTGWVEDLDEPKTDGNFTIQVCVSALMF